MTAASEVEVRAERPVTLEEFYAVAYDDARVVITPSVGTAMQPSREWVDDLFASDSGLEAPVYGINTGFGGLAGMAAFSSADTAAELSHRLIISTAAGTGSDLPREVVRGAMFIVIASVSRGLSGVPAEVVQTFAAMLNAGVTPVVPEYGSLGASGDLIPLAHVALVASRRDGVDRDEDSGEADFAGTRLSGAEAMREAGIERIVLGPKVGLALIAGTAFSTTLTALALRDAELAADHADLAVAMTVQAVTGFLDPFLPELHEARGYPGQIHSAARIRAGLEGSGLIDGSAERDPVNQPPQDAYSIRCAPQVHGAVRDVLAFARRTLETELAAVTDNPLVILGLSRSLKAVSGGNFHAEPIAFAADFLSIAATELASISERRIARLIDKALNRGLPPMLIPSTEAGLDCGFMMPQYLAAALVSDCKTLAHPDSVDSIPSSANQEDHVSMAMNAGRHARRVCQNAVTVMALELHAAAQALDIRMEMENATVDALSPVTRRAHAEIRGRVDFQSRDQVLYPRIEEIRTLVTSGALREWAVA